jgi:hypothetical protein
MYVSSLWHTNKINYTLGDNMVIFKLNISMAWTHKVYQHTSKLEVKMPLDNHRQSCRECELQCQIKRKKDCY